MSSLSGFTAGVCRVERRYEVTASKVNGAVTGSLGLAPRRDAAAQPG